MRLWIPVGGTRFQAIFCGAAITRDIGHTLRKISQRTVEKTAFENKKLAFMMAADVHLQLLDPLRYQNLTVSPSQTLDVHETISAYRLGSYGRDYQFGNKCKLCGKTLHSEDKSTLHPLVACSQLGIVIRRDTLKDNANKCLENLIRESIGEERRRAAVEAARPTTPAFELAAAVQIWSRWPHLVMIGGSAWTGYLLHPSVENARQQGAFGMSIRAMPSKQLWKSLRSFCQPLKADQTLPCPEEALDDRPIILLLAMIARDGMALLDFYSSECKLIGAGEII
jgi:hypothetical protein